jgi:hypothetical protein
VAVAGMGGAGAARLTMDAFLMSYAVSAQKLLPTGLVALLVRA